MSKTRIEWGTELTWPDGHSEVLRYGLDERHVAESQINLYNIDRKVGARLVQRTVVIGDWEPVEEAAPEADANPVEVVFDKVLARLANISIDVGETAIVTARDLASEFSLRSLPWISARLDALANGEITSAEVKVERYSDGSYALRV